MASRENAPRSIARSTRCQPQRRETTKGRTARARLPLVWTNRPVIMTISPTPMQKAVPKARGESDSAPPPQPGTLGLCSELGVLGRVSS